MSFPQRKKEDHFHSRAFTDILSDYRGINVDIYVNNKFVFVEKYIKLQITNLYRDAIMHRCGQKRDIIKNALAIATLSPNQFAYNLIKGPGYMAVFAVGNAHSIKCLPVDISVALRNECYFELKVTHNNKTKFLTPKTHILKNYGTQVVCNEYELITISTRTGINSCPEL